MLTLLANVGHAAVALWLPETAVAVLYAGASYADRLSARKDAR